ncbi:hypothetical protein [Plebeiibacterium sediminum]|nr:hypothetical protein [Plebeiobacterium sediminum]
MNSEVYPQLLPWWSGAGPEQARCWVYVNTRNCRRFLLAFKP